MALSQQKARRAASERTGGRGGQRVRRFTREVRAEMRKVVWPSRRDVVQFTAVVLVTVLIVGVLMGIVDLLTTQALTLILGWGG
ncbi:MAG: preprotein translocase subunit SecE [Bacillota bacterium]